MAKRVAAANARVAPKGAVGGGAVVARAHAYARAGMVGNPSDGYFGKTISFIIKNFRAQVTLTESARFEILPGSGDLAQFDSVADFLRDVKLMGYYGGMRLIKASVRRFCQWCEKNGHPLDHSRNFTVAYESNIPRLVGLAGSSAIITATWRALGQFYGVEVPKHLLPTLVLSTEKEELNIQAGLQDRVIQTYEGIVFMDFERAYLEKNGYGRYEELKPARVPPLYVAYDPERAEVSDVTHRDLRKLFNDGDPLVVGAMQKYRQLTDRGRSALLAGDWDELGRVMNENFDLRRMIMSVAPENLRMVEVAREAGASAKFAGSGGAICGLCDDAKFGELKRALASINCTVLRPQIFE
jgi:glucuronokinase